VCRNEVPFILPNFPQTKESKHEISDGVAAILLSHIVDNVDDSQARSRTISDSDSIYTSSSSQVAEDDDYIMHKTYQSSTTTESTVPSIDVPFEAHILPGRGRRFCAVLPVICVADSDNIISLLTSVLYQRRVWSIDQPAIGIVISKTGVVARVFLGWLDPESYDRSNLVRTHCVRCTPWAYGVFSLSHTLRAHLQTPRLSPPLASLISQTQHLHWHWPNSSWVSSHT
jgi:hypothetical protein